MEKKTATKDKAAPMSFLDKVRGIFRSETVRFIIGLLVVLFSVYLLLAFTSFFFTGAADQSIIDNATEAELASVDNGVENSAGARGAQLASYLINDCFGLGAFFIIIFLAAAGFRLMKVGRVRLWRWFIICFVLMIWSSVFLGYGFRHVYEDSFVYLGGLHGYNVGNWLESQVGAPGVWLILLAVAVCFLAYVSTRTVVWMRRLFSLRFLKKQAKAEAAAQPGETPEEFNASWGFKPKKADASEEKSAEPEPEPEPESDLDPDPMPDSADDVPLVFDMPQPEAPAEPSVRPVTASAEPAFDVEVNRDEYAPHQLEPYNPRLDLENYHFPTLDLLKEFDEGTLVAVCDRLLVETAFIGGGRLLRGEKFLARACRAVADGNGGRRAVVRRRPERGTARERDCKNAGDEQSRACNDTPLSHSDTSLRCRTLRTVHNHYTTAAEPNT